MCMLFHIANDSVWRQLMQPRAPNSLAFNQCPSELRNCEVEEALRSVRMTDKSVRGMSYGETDKRSNGPSASPTNGRADARTNDGTVGRSDGRTVGRTVGRTHGRTEKRTKARSGGSMCVSTRKRQPRMLSSLLCQAHRPHRCAPRLPPCYQYIKTATQTTNARSYRLCLT